MSVGSFSVMCNVVQKFQSGSERNSSFVDVEYNSELRVCEVNYVERCRVSDTGSKEQPDRK